MDAAVTPLISCLDDERHDALLVRVAGLRGFGLRDAADGAVVHGTGERQTIAGRVLGGLADDHLRSEASNHRGRRPTRITITDREADAAGMVCGGAADLLFSPIGDLPAKLADLLRHAQPVALAAAADGSGGDLVVARRQTFGSLGPALAGADEHIIALARAQLDGGSTATTTTEVDGATIVISTIVPATRMLVVGSGPMAEAIVAQAELMGWSAEIDESVERGIAFAEGAGPADGLAVISHDAHIDEPILHAALGSGIGYIGGMGSRGTQSRRRAALSALGHSETELERIHGPIGLDLGSRTPAETAVAIAAEFLANRSGRAPGSLRETSGPING